MRAESHLFLRYRISRDKRGDDDPRVVVATPRGFEFVIRAAGPSHQTLRNLRERRWQDKCQRASSARRYHPETEMTEATPKPSDLRALPDPADPRATAEAILFEIRRVIVGQDAMLERILVGLLSGGHLLLEGVPGPRQDADDQDPRRRPRRLVQAHPVHARPDAVRPRRDPHLPPGQGLVRRRAGPRLRQLPPRRRDQPRAGQGPVRAARGDAGAPGHDRPRHVQGARPRSSSSPPRTRSRPRAPTRCPRRRSTGSCSRSCSTTRTPPMRRRSSPARCAPARRRARSSTPRGCSALQRTVSEVYVDPRLDQLRRRRSSRRPAS